MIARARRVLQDITLLALDDRLLDDAAELGPFVLRTLDAIHLAAARSLGTALGRLVTYDRRMIQAAMDLGFAVESPA